MGEKAELEMEVLQIIEFQKLIESRHITNTGPVKNAAIVTEAKNRLEKVQSATILSNLRVRLHSYYITNSHVKNEKEEIVWLDEDFTQI